jgi:hypothetical protein
MVMNSSSAYVLSIAKGMEIELYVPSDPTRAMGAFPTSRATVNIDGVDMTPVLGFVSKFPKVGTIEPSSTSAGDITVKYKQIENGTNTIYFFSDTGESQMINIVNIPVHNHASVTQGGPAFGTYFADYTEEETAPPI